MGSQDKFRELKFEGTGIKLKWKNLSLELDSDFDSKVLSRLLETFSRLG